MTNKQKLKTKYKVRRFFLVLLVLALVGGGGWYFGWGKMMKTLQPSGEQPPAQSSKPEPQPSEPSASPEPESEPQPPPTTVSPNEWSLLLVNPDHPLPDGFEVSLVTVYESHRVDTRILEQAQNMFNEAKLRGISLFPCSAYRTVDYQRELFEEQIQQQEAAGLSKEDAAAIAATFVAVPGTSEHHTGLAMDIVTLDYQVLDEGFEQTEAFRWLDENAFKYGFILRYPRDKQDITGITYEPWHYRYVGVEHAAFIKERGVCLEEYLADGGQILTAEEVPDGQEADPQPSGEEQ